MLWLFPMKPVRVDEDIVSRIDPSEWTVERKLDGFRAIIIGQGDNVLVLTREQRGIVLPNNLKEQIKKIKIPDGTVLDGEIWNYDLRGSWNQGTPAKIHIWDVMFESSKWAGRIPIERRRQILKNLLVETDDIRIEPNFCLSRSKIQEIKEEFSSYELKSGGIHGVVLKKNGSTRADHSRRSIENASWLKIVWRM